MEQRISVHLKSPNPLFQQWITEMYEAAVSKDSKSQYSLKLALDSLKRYPLMLNSGSECAILKGFGKNLCKILDKKLQNKTNHSTPISLQSGGPSNSNSVKRSAENLPRKESAKKKSKSDYIPAYRSGPYAILLTLLENNQKGVLFLSKSALQTEAQFLCDESMIKPKPGSFYTAWSSMTSLITKGYVAKERKRCVQYSLTDSGKTLALELSKHSRSRDNINNSLLCPNIENNGNTDLINQPRTYTPSVISLVDDANIICPEEFNIDNVTKEADIYFRPGTFDVILLVDKQETSGKSKKNDATILELEKYKMIKYELRHLKVGDFTWVARHRTTNKELVLPHIVERKRMDDLAHSIKDGRFHEQKFRLKQCGIENIIYLIESHGNNHHNIGLPLSSLKQAAANTRIQDGFLTHFTSSLGHSIKFLAMMTKLLNDKYLDKSLYRMQRENEESSKNSSNKSEYRLFEFNSFNSMASKTKTLTVKDLFIKQLLQLKGISVEKAVAITSVYPTPRRLIEAFKYCEDKPELLLANIKYGVKLTKIGLAISKTLHKFFTDILLS